MPLSSRVQPPQHTQQQQAQEQQLQKLRGHDAPLTQLPPLREQQQQQQEQGWSAAVKRQVFLICRERAQLTLHCNCLVADCRLIPR